MRIKTEGGGVYWDGGWDGETKNKTESHGERDEQQQRQGQYAACYSLPGRTSAEGGWVLQVVANKQAKSACT